MLTVVMMMMMMQITMSVVNCYNSDGDADSCGDDNDDDDADNNVCCKLLQDPTPLPYLQHSDNYTFDIKLEVALSCKCLTQFWSGYSISFGILMSHRSHRAEPEQTVS